MFGKLAMTMARAMDAERAHALTIALAAKLSPSPAPAADAALAMRVCGINFAHPVGLAAGFDKDALAAHALGRFGFAGVEVGTLTPLPQDGNPRPRLFRLPADRGVINRMGFNNRGQADAMGRIAALYARADRPRLGVNIGANKDAADRVADYVGGVDRMAPHADWLTANISSPNTPGLRALQDAGALDALLAALADTRARLAGASPPLFLKVAPDLDAEQIGGVVRASIDHGVDAIIIGNTTVTRPSLRSAYAGEGGGLSGAPLATLALARLRDFRAATGGQIPLIAAGGIASADDAWARIGAGASLVQLYSALVFEGPWLPRTIARGLALRVRGAELESIAAHVGADVPGAV